MSNVQDGAGAADSGAQIWGGEQSGSKITRRRVIAGGAVVGTAVLALGLYFGLSGSDSSRSQNIISNQATDPNAEGCFIDTRERVMEAQYDSDAMTPALCNEHCESNGYFYYALQWGIECWCAPETTDITVNGVGSCDYACSGDDTQICGGLWSFTAYQVGVESTTPTPTPSSETTCDGTVATIRFATETAYFEGGGCATLTDMYNAQGGAGEGPLYVLDEADEVTTGEPTGRWLLDRDLRVTNGVTLYVHGLSIGGDADVLRIKSTSSEFYELRGYGGSLSFKSTTVTSWDTDNGQEREWDGDGRSFINCVTQFDDSALWDCTGASNQEHGECRMDIIDSVMGNMGWFDAESYGLTWKVRGMCTEMDDSTGLPVNHEIFEDHNVYGDIQNSEIYGMYYGHYSYGHQGGVWTDNIMRDNIQYGFDPHDDSDDLTISNNVVYGNGNHGIIASKRCNNVEISNNEVYDGGPDACGIFLHRSSDGAQVFGNYVHDMQDAGIAFMESFDAEVYDNVFENTKYGIRLSLGSGNNKIYNNEFSIMSQYGLYTYMGSDEPDVPGSDGRPYSNEFDGNTISEVSIGVHIKEGDGNIFTNNVFSGVDTFEFEDSTGTVWVDNNDGGACLDSDTDFAEGSIASC
ncbi:unnamed protein product [Scytosiphon promiscuus]